MLDKKYWWELKLRNKWYIGRPNGLGINRKTYFTNFESYICSYYKTHKPSVKSYPVVLFYKLKNWLSLRCEMGRFPSILFAAPEFISQAYCCICILLFSWWTSISEMSFNICLEASGPFHYNAIMLCNEFARHNTHLVKCFEILFGLHHLFCSKTIKHLVFESFARKMRVCFQDGVKFSYNWHLEVQMCS